MLSLLRRNVVAPFTRLGRGPTLFLGFIAFNMLSCAALVGSVLVLHAVALGIDTAWIGVLNSLMPFAMMITIVMTGPAQRLGSKRLLMSGWTMRNIMILPIVFTPLAFKWWGSHGAAIVLFLGVGMFCLVRAITGIGWSSWLHEIVDTRHRGLYFTIESVVSRGVDIVFGVMVYLFFLGSAPLWKFSALSAFGVAAGLTSVLFLVKVPGGAPSIAADKPTRPVREEYRQVMADSNFRPFLLLMVAGTFAGSAHSLILTLFMRKYLDLADGTILLIGAFASVVTMMTLHRWTRIADTHGSSVTMAAAGFMVAGCLCTIGLIGHGHWGLVAIALNAVLLAVGGTGFFVACNRSYMHRIVPEMRHAYVAMWSTTNSLSAGVSSILVGLLVRSGSHQAFTWTSLGFAVLMAGVCIMLLRLPERGVDLSSKACRLYDPSQPMFSILRMYSYVLMPMPASDALDTEDAGRGREN